MENNGIIKKYDYDVEETGTLFLKQKKCLMILTVKNMIKY